jgi:hypothetical protein
MQSNVALLDGFFQYMSIKSMGIKMTIYDVIKIDLINKIILYETSNF